jgi:phage regulator Rha-like protein
MENQLLTIQNLIYEIRGHKVMLDSDLAELYGIESRVLNQTVKRNINRFPNDFMFQLTDSEWNRLRSQFVISNAKGGRRYLPYAFTEQGVSMLSSVLNSDKAIEINIAIMRIFVKIRQIASQETYKINEIKELRQILLLHIDNTDKRFGEQNKKINQIIEVLNNLLEHPNQNKNPLGYRLHKNK